MSNPVNFDELAIGSVFFIEDPYRQYYVKLKPFEVDGRWHNAEELESGKPIQFTPSPRFSVYSNDGGESWLGPD